MGFKYPIPAVRHRGSGFRFSASPLVSIVQSVASPSFAAKTSYTLSLTGVKSTSGLLVVADVGSGDVASVTAPGYTPTKLYASGTAYGSDDLELWYLKGGAGGSVVVTVDNSTDTASAGILLEAYSNQSRSPSVQSNDGGTTGAGETWSSLTDTPTSSGCTVFYAFHPDSGCNSGGLPTSPWVASQYGLSYIGTAYQSNSPKTGQSTSYTQFSSAPYATIGIVLAP